MTPHRKGLFALVFALVCAGTGGAHEIPNEVVARLIAKPEGDRFHLLARVPLRSMRDIEFPTLESGYLDLEALKPQLADLASVWIAGYVEIYEDGVRLPQATVTAVQISLPSDRSFASFDRALTRFEAPYPANSENLAWEQVLLDVRMETPIRSNRSEFSIRPGLEHLALKVTTTLLVETPEGVERAYQLDGDQGRLPLDPSWGQVAWRFVRMGFEHILDGPDHLLFLACLVIPFRRLRPLVGIVTAFTVAHSLTLFASALGYAPDGLWFPPLIETLIAASIVYMALENIVGVAGARRRWMFAFGFGLVHGFGFSFALRETLQFAGSRLWTSLAAFNVGVEAGQLLVVAMLVPALEGLFRFVVDERKVTIILSAFVAHTGWHWLTERWEELRLYEIERMW